MPKRREQLGPEQITRIVKELRPGKRVGVAQCISVTVDSDGRVRYQVRVRVAGAGSRFAGGTHDTIEEAIAERDRLLELRADGVAARAAANKRIKLTQYVEREWWPHVLRLRILTRIDYGRVYEQDIVPYWRGWTLRKLAAADVSAIKEYRTWLERRKTGPDGTVARAAVEKALNLLSRILDYALAHEVIDRNPVAVLRNIERKQSSGSTDGRAHATGRIRPIRPREAQHPLTVERIRLAMPGSGIRRLINRVIIDLLFWEGLRPEEIPFLRNEHWRGPDGPHRFLTVEGTIVDAAGTLVPGPPKNGKPRDVPLWAPVAERLEALYQASGCPGLGALTIPNTRGGWLRWDNFRDRSFYTALAAGGIAARPEPRAAGAFPPYSGRHTLASLLFVARQEDEDARYPAPDIAQIMGHTLPVLLQTYTHVMKDVHGYAGKTISEIIRLATRQVWGPMPGDPDYVETRLTLAQAAQLTGISDKALAARAARGSLAARKERGLYVVTATDLVLSGLATPAQVAELRSEG